MASLRKAISDKLLSRKAESETETRFDVEGMSCGHCKAAIEGELGNLLSVNASADVEGGVVDVSYDEARIGTDQLKEAIEKAGYTVRA